MLHINKDKRGRLISINDILNQIPFRVKRFMHISDVPEGETRGYHAHRTNEQLLLCFSGEVSGKTINKNSQGELEEKIHELKTGDFLYMPPMTWGEQTYHNDAVLHVLCSKKYNEDDYVRDYEEFKNN